MKLVNDKTVLNQDDVDHIFRIAHTLMARDSKLSWSEATALATRQYVSPVRHTLNGDVAIRGVCTCDQGHTHEVAVARQANGDYIVHDIRS